MGAAWWSPCPTEVGPWLEQFSQTMVYPTFIQPVSDRSRDADRYKYMPLGLLSVASSGPSYLHSFCYPDHWSVPPATRHPARAKPRTSRSLIGLKYLCWNCFLLWNYLSLKQPWSSSLWITTQIMTSENNADRKVGIERINWWQPSNNSNKSELL